MILLVLIRHCHVVLDVTNCAIARHCLLYSNWPIAVTHVRRVDRLVHPRVHRTQMQEAGYLVLFHIVPGYTLWVIELFHISYPNTPWWPFRTR